MPTKKIVCLQDDEKWNRYLIEAFQDTPSTPRIAFSIQEGLPLIRLGHPDVVFAAPKFLNKALAAALQANRAANADFRVFRLGGDPKNSYPFDGGFDAIPPSLHEFQKRLVEILPLPDPLHILLVDDEPELGELFRDYFDRRTRPGFVIEIVTEIRRADERIRQFSPHVIVLDLRWPEGGGRELYAALQARPNPVPIVILTELFSPEEILEIRRLGRSAIVEKEAPSSAMPVLAALVKKLSYFG